MRVGARWFLLPAVLIAGLAGGRPDGTPAFQPARDCGTDVGLPIEVSAVVNGPLRPGSLASAEVEITALRSLDEVRLTVKTPQDLRLLSVPPGRLGALGKGKRHRASLTFMTPPGRERRTVEIVVEGEVDGLSIRRGTVLNLAYDQEPHRTVTTPDGRRVREVAARRIG
jgi:hypothetical protein